MSQKFCNLTAGILYALEYEGDKNKNIPKIHILTGGYDCTLCNTMCNQALELNSLLSKINKIKTTTL